MSDRRGVDVTSEIVIARPRSEVATFAADPDGGTRMTLRNRGTPSGFAKIGATPMVAAMRRDDQHVRDQGERHGDHRDRVADRDGMHREQ